MSKSNVNLQDSFLNQVRRDGRPARLTLLDGSELTGTVSGFDNFTVVLHCEEEKRLVYKHAIAQLIASKDLDLSPPKERDREPRKKKKEKNQEAEGQKEKSGFNKLDLSGVQAELSGSDKN